MASEHVQEPNEPFIRPVNPDTDKAGLDRIFRATCNPALQHEPAWTISSYLWCHPYPILSPDFSFVVDSGNGEAVGYIVGTQNTQDFAQGWPKDYVPTLDCSKLPPPPKYDVDGTTPPTWNSDLPGFLLHLLYNDPIGLLNGAYPDMVEQYPAHLHIDLLPDYQRQGWGRKLIDTFCEAVKRAGTRGIHLGMEVRNMDEAGKFYERLGFTRFPRVLSDDVDGRMGETASVIYLVKEV